jgi:hypothetical protein
MTEEGGMSEDETEGPAGGVNRRLIAIGAAAVVVIALLVVWAVSGDDSGDAGDGTTLPSAAPTASDSISPGSTEPSVTGSDTGSPETSDQSGSDTTPSATDSTAPATTAPPPVTTEGPAATAPVTAAPTLPPVEASLDDPAVIAGGVEVEITKIEAVEGEAEGVGERDGPSLRLTVALTNGTDAAISTDLALVNLYYGEDLTPATMLSGPGVENFPSTAEAGATVTGVLVFLVPEDQRDHVVVEFTYSTEAAKAIFTGAVG